MLASSKPDYFDVIHGAYDGWPHKPDESSTHHILKQLGEQPGDCFLLGDSYVDLEAGELVHMDAGLLTHGYNSHADLQQYQERCAFFGHDLNDFMNWLRG